MNQGSFLPDFNKDQSDIAGPIGSRLTYGLACVTSKNTVNRHIPGSSGNDVSSFWW